MIPQEEKADLAQQGHTKKRGNENDDRKDKQQDNIKLQGNDFQQEAKHLL